MIVYNCNLRCSVSFARRGWRRQRGHSHKGGIIRRIMSGECYYVLMRDEMLGELSITVNGSDSVYCPVEFVINISCML